jgi:hypothetical protein
MTTLSELRNELASLVDGVSGWPSRTTPPVVFVVPGTPWLTGGQGGLTRFTFDVVLAAAHTAQPADSLTAVEEMTTAVVAAIEPPWSVTQGEQPSTVTINGTDYLGTVITVTTQRIL